MGAKTSARIFGRKLLMNSGIRFLFLKFSATETVQLKRTEKNKLCQLSHNFPFSHLNEKDVKFISIESLVCKTVVFFAGLLAKAQTVESIGSLDTARALRASLARLSPTLRIHTRFRPFV